MFHHCGVHVAWPPLYVFGSCGVHFFFVLSGFLLYRPFAVAMAKSEPMPGVRNYLVRRLIRILPPYWVALVAFVGLRALAGVQTPTAWDVVAHALLIFNVDPRLNLFGINGVFWSLAIEVQFYVLLPLIAVASGRWSPRALAAWVPPIACIAVGIASRLFEIVVLSPHYTNGIDFIVIRNMPSYLDLFGFGMLAAVLHLRWPGEAIVAAGRRWLRPCVGVAGVTLFLAANTWNGRVAGGHRQAASPLSYLLGFSPVLCAGMMAILLWVLWSPRRTPAILGARPLVGLGVISYSLYLYHTGVQFFVFKLNIGHDWSWNAMTITNALISLPIATVASTIMYLLVERPSLAAVARIRSRHGARAGAASPTSLSLLAP